MKVLIDTDILSMFAKVDAVEVLIAFLGRDRVAMTPGTREEIATPLHYGYTFPEKVLSQMPVVLFTEQIWEVYEQLWTRESSLGKGELEAIAFCKVTGAMFATNDAVARRVAQNHNIPVISLQAILRGLWQSGMQSQEEVQRLLQQIKEADSLEVPPAVEREIFAGHGENKRKDPQPP